MTIRTVLLGDEGKYDYWSMCMPSNPFGRGEKTPLNFYGKDEPIPIVLALLMGLQHAFAMIGGLITPPLVVIKFAVCGFPFCPELEQYAISASLITSGTLSAIQVSHFLIPYSERIFGRKMFIGSGLLSVMGTSFTFLPVYEIAISQMKENGIDGRDAYGKMLGTSIICGLLIIFLACLPVKTLKTVFPPLVTSVTVMLIGTSLIGTGMKYWGGGVVCAEMIWKEHSQLVATNTTLPPPYPTCTNGETTLGYGSPEYIGLGFSVIVMLVFIELFGSVFFKNCNVFLALLFGYFVAAVSNYNGMSYVTNENFVLANPITFLWVETFPLGFYGPAVIPLLIAFLVTAVETVGDITAGYEASYLDTESPEYMESVQGGLGCDAVGSILACLFTSMPNTTFAQNNGVISLTKCASRRAGYGCAFWLITMGVFGKFAGLITSIPDCVIGGMTIFLFANVLASGIALAATIDLHSRRNKFVLAMSLAIGVGVTIWPFAFQDMRASSYTANFWRCEDCNETMKGIRNGVSIFLSTGYCVGAVIAILLNLILPADAEIKFFDDKIGAMETSNFKDKSGTTYTSENKNLPSRDEEVPTSEKISDEDDEDRI